MLIQLISTPSHISVLMTLFMTSYCKNRLENDVITPDMKSAGIHLMNFQSFIPTPTFLFLEKSTGPILPFVALNLWGFFKDWPSSFADVNAGRTQYHSRRRNNLRQRKVPKVIQVEYKFTLLYVSFIKCTKMQLIFACSLSVV